MANPVKIIETRIFKTREGEMASKSASYVSSAKALEVSVEANMGAGCCFEAEAEGGLRSALYFFSSASASSLAFRARYSALYNWISKVRSICF